MIYIRRDLEKPIQAFLQSSADQIILLSGARQSGKSTLVENLDCGKQKVFINLWDEERETLALRKALSGTCPAFEENVSCRKAPSRILTLATS